MSNKKSTVYPFYFRDGAGGTTSKIKRRLQTMTAQAFTKFPPIIILTSLGFEAPPHTVQNASKEKYYRHYRRRHVTQKRQAPGSEFSIPARLDIKQTSL
jgi:hypothetical protein